MKPALFFILSFTVITAHAQTKIELQRAIMDSITAVLNEHEILFFSGVVGEKTDTTNKSEGIIETAEGGQQKDSCLCNCTCYFKYEEDRMRGFMMKNINPNKVTIEGETLWIHFTDAPTDPLRMHIEDARKRKSVKHWLEQMASLCAE